jgi:hypothetical protein
MQEWQARRFFIESAYFLEQDLLASVDEGGLIMPRGDKGAYTDKQKRQAEHIEEGYEKKGVSKKEAESRAWATVNKESGGGKKSGSGRGKEGTKSSSKKGGKKR